MQHNSEEQNLNICYDCNKQDDCLKRSETIETCEDFDEARYCLTPKGIFCLVIDDMGFADAMSKKCEIAWELYEHRTKGELVLDKNVFKKVLVDMEFVEENSKESDIAFEFIVSRMKDLGYLKEEEQ